MKVYPLHREDGELYAFEIRNAFVSSGETAAFFKRCEGCEVTSVRRLFGPGDTHLVFAFSGTTFEVIEPFGDNSRLLVSPKEGQVSDLEIMKMLVTIVERTRHIMLFSWALPRHQSAHDR